MKKFVERFTPFLVLGIAVVIGVVGLFFAFYLLIWGAVVAVILYCIAWVRNKFSTESPKSTVPKKGRTIDHEP